MTKTKLIAPAIKTTALAKAEVMAAATAAQNAAKNAKFLKLPKAKQRVVIAQDVLQQLTKKRIKPTQGLWFDLPEAFQRAFLRTQNNRSDTGLNNQVTTSLYSGTLDGHAVGMTDYLKTFFTESQLALIEAAFERGGGAMAVVISNKLRRTARAFGDAYPDNTKRLRAIMKNIINNDGTFKP